MPLPGSYGLHDPSPARSVPKHGPLGALRLSTSMRRAYDRTISPVTTPALQRYRNKDPGQSRSSPTSVNTLERCPMNRALGGAFTALHNLILDPGSHGEVDSTLPDPGSGLDGMAFSRPGTATKLATAFTSAAPPARTDVTETGTGTSMVMQPVRRPPPPRPEDLRSRTAVRRCGSCA